MYWELRTQTYEHVGAILIQTSTPHKQNAGEGPCLECRLAATLRLLEPCHVTLCFPSTSLSSASAS